MVMSNSKLSKRNYKRRTDKATQSSSAQIKDAHKAAVLTVGAAGVLVGASLVFNPTAVMAENAVRLQENNIRNILIFRRRHSPGYCRILAFRTLAVSFYGFL